MSVIDSSVWPAATDPFSAVYILYAKALLNNAYLANTAGLKVGNLNVWCDGRQQILWDKLGPGDTPEVTLVQTQYVPHPQGDTSKSASFKVTIQLVAITDTIQIAKVNAIKWGVTAAMQWANPSGTWAYNGALFVKDYTISGGGDGSSGITLPTLQNVADAQRGVNAMGTLLTTTFDLYIDRGALPQ